MDGWCLTREWTLDRGWIGRVGGVDGWMDGSRVDRCSLGGWHPLSHVSADQGSESLSCLTEHLPTQHLPLFSPHLPAPPPIILNNSLFTEHSLCLHTLLKLLVHLDISLGHSQHLVWRTTLCSRVSVALYPVSVKWWGQRRHPVNVCWMKKAGLLGKAEAFGRRGSWGFPKPFAAQWCHLQ